MSVPSSAIPLSPAGGAPQGETLYESPSTRIVRLGGWPSESSVVSKEYLGSHAAQRLRNERALLMRLGGIEGVAQLADDAGNGDMLLLRDCAGTSLAQVLVRRRLEIDAVLALAVQLARILAHVHAAGIIHRDINPTNILVTASQDAVLIDFDLAAPLQPSAVEPGRQIVGALSYIAPEQTGRTGRPVDQRADLYGLGATLYEMTAGRPPFGEGDALQLIYDHLVREPTPPSQIDERVPEGVSRIVLRLLAKAPEQRYQSAQGLLHDLQLLRDAIRDGGPQDFRLGERDFAVRLVAPARLVGRDEELAVLQNAFAAAMLGRRRTALVHGPAGVGKSALVNELRPFVEEAGTWFIQGKFDQYQRDGSTEGALAQALRALGRMLLTLSGDRAAAVRQKILTGLGGNAAMISRISPEFALLLGEHAEIPQADPRQGELQLQQAMLDLVAAVASPRWPLVIVVNDLHWAGAFSLRLFERLVTDADLRGVFLVGTYRSEEVGADHLLTPFLKRWSGLADAPVQIPLANLGVDSVGEMTRQILRLAPGDSNELAGALCALTGGNPFDTIEMINALRVDGVLTLDPSGWRWDEADVRHFVGRGNVVDLLAARIGRLPAPSRDLLSFMSLLGSTVDCNLLCVAVGLADDEVRAQLRVPLEDGLLEAGTPGGQDSVRFRHDRVQQALVGATPESLRGERQLAMARRLAAAPGFENWAAEQYMACTSLLVDAHEKQQAARLFHGLAQTLASTATYNLAERYLQAADELLASVDDPADADLRRAIDVARHCALYSLGRMEEADPVYERIAAGAHDPLDLVDPTCLQIRRFHIHGRMNDAVSLGASLLERLGLQVPPDVDDKMIDQRLDVLTSWVLQQRARDLVGRVPNRDPRVKGIARLLARLSLSATASGSESYMLLQWFHLEAFRLWASHDPDENLLGCISHLGVILTGRREQFRMAYAFSRDVVAVGEAMGFEVRTAGARFGFAYRACQWVEPLEVALEHATRASEVFQARGDDAAFACYFNVPLVNYSMEIGPTIGACEAQLQKALEVSRRRANFHAEALYTCDQQFLRALRGETRSSESFDDADFSEEAFLAKAGMLPWIAIQFPFFRSHLALLMGDTASLVRHAPQVVVDGVFSGIYRTMHGHLFVAMARAWQLQRGDVAADERAGLIDELASRRSWLAGRADDQPFNFLHLLLLVEAEEAWALGDLWKAAARFDAAMLEVDNRPRPWHRALIVERAGRFHLSQGMLGTGRQLLAKARDAYQAWGAAAKVDQMHREHAFLRTPAPSLGSRLGLSANRSHPGSANISPDVLDLLGVLRASQALSSETSLERLSARVTEVLVALSGATKAVVLSWDDDQWWLLTSTPGEPALPLAEAAERALVPLSAVQYAERTGETLVVDDALADDRFARDPYFAGLSACSLLVVCIAGQQHSRAMLVLENRHGRAAFNPQRLDAVMLIAGQLAVSLTNARVYQSLERRVQARTRELEQAQAQLLTTARRAGMAEVANNVLHNIGNVCNSITVSASMARANLANSKLSGLGRAVELLNARRDKLGDYLSDDPQGKAWLPYVNELVSTLEAERLAVIEDLDRLTRSVDHVNHVLTSQQSHAGGSRFLELVRVDELIDEALRISADDLARHDVRVVRDFQPMPTGALDRPRLLQVLVNLIANATDAMEKSPREHRVLTVAVGLVFDEERPYAKRMRLTVRDTGEGIAPENLKQIFAHGFTTRAKGHGFGLHSSVVAAMEMDGELTAQSDGPGCGAMFVLEIPLIS